MIAELHRTVEESGEPEVRPVVFHAYADHGGAPCSLYIGFFPEAFAEALAYRARHGGSVHLEAVS